MRPRVMAAAGGRRQRLDRLLVLRELAENLEQAARLVLSGTVLVAGQRVDKVGSLVDPAAPITLASRLPYVSRGGAKLAHALDVFGISPDGRVCLDVGAATGGFTHCLLLRGAARVYAVDVGHGQLDPKLRSDPRVVLRERVNARKLDPEGFIDPPDLATVDVSFVSLAKILPPVFRCLREPAEVVCLVKPQFEVERGAVGKGGVVREAASQREVLVRLARFSVLSGWHVLGVTPSPLRGPKGNREFFLHLGRYGRTLPALEARIAGAVQEEGKP